MKKLVISLKDAQDRRQHIAEQFENKNIPYEFFDAIDATQIDAIARELNMSIANTLLGKNEIACFLSHASIWQLAVDNNYPYVCIFEDDVYLGEDSEFYLNNILEWKPDDAHILKLEVYNKTINFSGSAKNLQFGDRNLVKLATKHTGCAGYVITLETALTLLNIVRNYGQLIPVDHIVFGDFLHSYAANIYQIVPAICIQSQRHNLTTPLISYLESERKIRFGTPETKNKIVSKVFREGKRLTKQLSNTVDKINFKFKGIKVLKLSFR